MDILKPILDIYDEKKEVLTFYLDGCIKDKIVDLDYLDDGHELFLNDRIYIINRATLELEHSGIIQSIKDDIVCIKVKCKYSVHFKINEYHVFIKRKKNKKNDRDFYKAMLNAL